MKGILCSTVVLLLMAAPVAAQDVPAVTVSSMPPVVVKTVPQAGALSIDPALKEIRVTFSKEMMTDQMWSWVKVSNETFPVITDKIRYLDDKRTCIAPVSLEPGKTYVIWINSEHFNSFRDLNNNPAIPYLLVFKTSREKGLPPQQLEQAPESNIGE